MVYMYESKDSSVIIDRIGLNASTVTRKGDTVVLENPEGKFELTAESASDADEWVAAIEKGIQWKWESYFGVFRVLGKGAFATVHGGYDRQTNEQIAIKILKKKNIAPEHLQLLLREYRVLSTFHHPDVVRCIALFNAQDTLTAVFELMGGGTVGQWMDSRGSRVDADYVPAELCLEEPAVREIYLNAFRAIHGCHVRGIVHRDLKPENIMLKTRESGKLGAKLIDFGFANFYEVETEYFEPVMSTLIGTPAYSAPEMFERKALHGPAVDIFALGASIFFGLAGCLPFAAKNEAHMIKRIRFENIKFTQPVWKHVSDDAKQVILKTMQRDPVKRITALAALQCKWFEGLPGHIPRDPPFIAASPVRRFRAAAYTVLFFRRIDALAEARAPRRTLARMLSDTTGDNKKGRSRFLSFGPNDPESQRSGLNRNNLDSAKLDSPKLDSAKNSENINSGSVDPVPAGVGRKKGKSMAVLGSMRGGMRSPLVKSPKSPPEPISPSNTPSSPSTGGLKRANSLKKASGMFSFLKKK